VGVVSFASASDEKSGAVAFKRQPDSIALFFNERETHRIEMLG